MMNLIKKKGTLGVRGHTILYVLIGLLVSEASSQAADSPEGELSSVKLRLDLLMSRYRHLCNQYSSLASNCSSPVINCTECPDRWLHVEDQCFFLSTDKQDWPSSAAECTKIGGHLAILTTREQHKAVEKEGRRIGGLNTNYWIGLTDIESEGNWTWVDNSTLKNPFWSVWTTHVGTKEPDNNLSGGADGEDCAVVDSYTQSWYDVPCSYLNPRICQKDAIPLQ